MTDRERAGRNPSAEPYYLPMACPICGRHRMEWDGHVLRCEKCGASSEWGAFIRTAPLPRTMTPSVSLLMFLKTGSPWCRSYVRYGACEAVAEAVALTVDAMEREGVVSWGDNEHRARFLAALEAEAEGGTR